MKTAQKWRHLFVWILLHYNLFVIHYYLLTEDCHKAWNLVSQLSIFISHLFNYIYTYITVYMYICIYVYIYIYIYIYDVWHMSVSKCTLPGKSSIRWLVGNIVLRQSIYTLLLSWFIGIWKFILFLKSAFFFHVYMEVWTERKSQSWKWHPLNYNLQLCCQIGNTLIFFL